MAAAAVPECLFLTNSGTSTFRCSLYSPVVSLRLRAATLPSRLAQKCLFLFPACFAVQGIEVEEKIEAETGPEIRSVDENRTKLYVVNLPWSFSASDLEKLFAQCGTVEEVEIIKLQDGRSKGYAFVTMASPKEAQSAIGKLDSFVRGFGSNALFLVALVSVVLPNYYLMPSADLKYLANFIRIICQKTMY